MAPPKQTQTNFTCESGFADVVVGRMRLLEMHVQIWGTGFARYGGGGGGGLPTVLDLEEAPRRGDS